MVAAVQMQKPPLKSTFLNLDPVLARFKNISKKKGTKEEAQQAREGLNVWKLLSRRSHQTGDQM